MKQTISEYIKLSFYDSVSEEDVDIVELQDIKNILEDAIDNKKISKKWLKEFFEL